MPGIVILENSIRRLAAAAQVGSEGIAVECGHDLPGRHVSSMIDSRLRRSFFPEGLRGPTVTSETRWAQPPKRRKATLEHMKVEEEMRRTIPDMGT
jgi:hypothetical protein